MLEENALNSNITKLWRHIPKILNIRENPRPISLVTVVTSKCNLRCEFCYVLNRSREDELDFEKLKKFISTIKPLGVEVTGGEPALYPYINEYLEWLYDNGFKVGMTSNGLLLNKIKSENLKKLSWLRVSINRIIDKDIDYKDFTHPKHYGYSYIVYSKSPNNLHTKLLEFMSTHEGEYLKIAGDVTDYTRFREIYNFKKYIGNKIYIQSPIREKWYIGRCYMVYLKPILEPDGNVYACVGNTDPIKRQKYKAQAITTIDNPEKLLKYENIYKGCKRCSFIDRNLFIEYLLKEHQIHEEFL